MIIRDEIWVLSDGRAGNFSQAIGLASEIGFESRVINISFGFFSFLPNIILRSSLFGISCKTKKQLHEINYFPKLIISAGRGSAPVMLYLKKKSKNKIKIAQIMNPEVNHKCFDFIILPRHDSFGFRYKNIFETLGSLGKVNEKLIKIEAQKFASWFNYEKIKIALLIGGDGKNTSFDQDSAKNLAKQVSLIAKNMNAKLLVLNSRRTSDQVTSLIKSSLDCDYKFFEWKNIQEENPYLAIVGISNFFIATGDSVSMISEICSTGKPIYIFDDKNISAKKHRKFHSDLIAGGYAKTLTKDILQLDEFSSKKLNETKRIAMIIKKMI